MEGGARMHGAVLAVLGKRARHQQRGSLAGLGEIVASGPNRREGRGKLRLGAAAWSVLGPAGALGKRQREAGAAWAGPQAHIGRALSAASLTAMWLHMGSTSMWIWFHLRLSAFQDVPCGRAPGPGPHPQSYHTCAWCLPARRRGVGLHGQQTAAVRDGAGLQVRARPQAGAHRPGG